MSRHERLLERILRGGSDANLRFADLVGLMRYLGFEERITGSHHIFRKEGIVEKVNLQRDGSDAKTYQVRQVRQLIAKHRLGKDE